MASTSPPEVLLVEGEPVIGLELDRHIVPAPLCSRRVLASDAEALRAALLGPVVAAVVDARTDVNVAASAIRAIRALPGGHELHVLVLVGAGVRAGDPTEEPADVRESGERIVEGWWAEPHVDLVRPPHALGAIHARLRLLAGGAARFAPASERLRTA